MNYITMAFWDDVGSFFVSAGKVVTRTVVTAGKVTRDYIIPTGKAIIDPLLGLAATAVTLGVGDSEKGQKLVAGLAVAKLALDGTSAALDLAEQGAKVAGVQDSVWLQPWF